MLGMGEVLSAGMSESSALKGLVYCTFMERFLAGSVQALWSGIQAQALQSCLV